MNHHVFRGSRANRDRREQAFARAVIAEAQRRHNEANDFSGKSHTPEAIERISKAKLREKNPNWKGDAVSNGRGRANNWYPPKPCAKCGAEPADRHHVDGNTINNEPSNIVFLCRKCHMKEDGRADRLGQASPWRILPRNEDGTFASHAERAVCPDCKGKGEVNRYVDDLHVSDAICLECGGRGWIF